MNFFKPQELEILNTYPKNRSVMIRDYLCDFVIKNPLNFPYSSYIIKRSREKEAGTAIKEYFVRESVLNCLDSIVHRRYEECDVFDDMLQCDTVCFTALALCIFCKYYKARIIIHQNGENMILSISDGNHKHLAMIDKTGRNLICYHTSDSLSVYQMFSKSWNNVTEISKAADIGTHFYFEFTQGREIDQVLCLFMALTTNFPPSWFSPTFKLECCKYEFKNSIMSDYNILRLCDSDFECVEDAVVKNTTRNEGIVHIEQASESDLLNKVL